MSKSVTFAIAGIALGVAGAILALKTAPAPVSGAGPASQAATTNTLTLRLGIIPERDVFAQRKAYLALATYLETKPAFQAMPVQIRTASSYAGALKDLEEGEVDAAFVGSLVAVLAHDRFGAQVVLKSETLSGQSTYAGVVVVRADSPVKEFRDLAATPPARIGGVKTTTAGAVYPLYLIRELGWAATDVPALVWAGTHDDVLADVAAGKLDAGAVKDARFTAYVAAHPDTHLRPIAESRHVPNNALVVRKEMPPAQRAQLVALLLAMDTDPAGPDASAAEVLKGLELKRFVAADISEYGPLYDMIEAIGPGWFAMDVGPAPKRPAAPASAKGGE